MEKKRLTKYVWYGSDVDENGNPVLPDVASPENHLEGLNKGELYIHIANGITTLWTVSSDGKVVPISGASIEELSNYFLRKDKDDRSVGHIASDKGFEAGKFNVGSTGAACYQDKDGNWHIETDHLKVRKKASFTEVEIETTYHVGGQQISTGASMVVDYVLEMDSCYRCYFLKKDNNGRVTTNKWKPKDQAYCNTFNLVKQEDGTLSNHYLWRLVNATSNETADDAETRVFGDVTINTADYHFTDLSKTVFAEGSDIPKAMDEIVLLGHQGNDESRQGCIIVAGAGEGSPYIYEFTGIGIEPFTLPEPETKIKPNDNMFTGVMHIQGNSTGAANLADLNIGAVNLLLNSGFTGDYKAEDLGEAYNLKSGTELFSRGMKHWTGTATIGDDEEAVSGKSAHIGKLSQSVLLIKGENYVVSFKAKGVSLDVSVGDKTTKQELTSKYEHYSLKFVSDGVGSFAISGDATICDIQLERGIVATDWNPSPYDNDKALAALQAVKYLQDAICDGDTTILGGLILSSMIQLGNYKDGKMQKVNAGMSGIYNDDDDVAFWGGGTFEQAIRTIIKFKQNPNYRPTTSEWADMANFVVSHGGDLFLRGYIHALGGYFRGEINAEKGVFKNVKSPNNSFVIDDEGNVKIVGTFETSVQGKRIVIDANNQNIVLYDELGRETAKINFYGDVGESWTYGTVALKRYQQSSLNVEMECFIAASQMDIIDYITKYESHYRAGFMQLNSFDGQHAEISIGLNKSFTSATEYNWKSNVQFGNLPTSASEVGTGGIYNDNGTLKVKQ